MHTVAIVAGEASGDLLGSLLIGALKARFPDLEFVGIAGPRMQAMGARSWHPMEILSVRGYVEALANLRAILGIRKRLRARLLAEPPRLFIGIDAPDFNLSLEADLRAAGIQTVHFISPSIWAWRPERIEAIRRAVAHMLLVFPFEEDIYRRAGIPATYVGHPLAQALPANPDRTGARARLGLDASARYVALLPGSRDSEVGALASLFADTARHLKDSHPDLVFLVPLVKPEHRSQFETRIAALGLPPGTFDIRQGQAHDIMQAVDAALIASGTATLEALLLDCPHVISYRVPRLTYWLMKRRACIDMVGLPNILAGRRIVPEMIQENATPARLAAAVGQLLDDPDAVAAMHAAFAPIRGSLRRDTPAEIVAALAPFLA
jgi:lipid-A-disaccharide synthase